MRMQGTDRDLAAHFAVIRQVGIKVWGKPIKEYVWSGAQDAYEDSIRRDAPGRFAGNFSKTCICHFEFMPSVGF